MHHAIDGSELAHTEAWLSATIVAVMVVVALVHGPVMAAALSFAAGLLAAPLIATPVFSVSIVFAGMPAVVIAVVIVTGKQGRWLLAG